MATIDATTVPANGLPDPPHRDPGHARPDRRSSPSTPAPAPSAPRRTGWPTSSSTSSSRAARSTPTTATSTRPPSGSGACSTPTRATTSSPSTSPSAPSPRRQAIDLLIDFVGRPRLDAEELDRERGVVIQEINRSYDQPSTVAEYLIDRAAFGDHPLGRTVLGPEENLRSVHARGRSSPSASAAGRAPRGGAFLVGNIEQPARRGGADRALRPLPRAARARAVRARARVRAADARGAARHQPVAPAHDLPPADRRLRPARARRAGDLRDPARRLDGLAPVR